MRRINFQKAVLRGPEYVCSSCHRSLYRKSVVEVTERMREKIKKASEEKVQKAGTPEFKVPANPENSKQPFSRNPPEAHKSKLKKRTNEELSFAVNAFKAWSLHTIKSVGNLTYLCKTCSEKLQIGKIPAMSVANGLQLGHHNRPNLSEVENNLIAHTINFQKMVLLPKSRMAASKGRMISIPVEAEDIMNTVKQLPRLPTEAGVVPIKLKRKKEYKSHEKNEMIRPEKIFLALQFLRNSGNPYYQFYDQKEAYLARCKIKDQRGLRLLEEDMDDIEEDLEKPVTPETMEVEDEANKDSDEEGEDEMEIALEQEEEDIENDPVRRQHFNYNEYSALVNGHPEIFLDDDGNQTANLDFAPGEGKRPTSFLNQKDWDHKSWPMLLPDGKFGLSHKRKVNLTRQSYFQQRILNVDDRFAKTPGYIFGAMSLVEAERLRNNANLTGMKGRRTFGPDGQVTYQLEDPCAVFEKVKGTPKYWQRAKFEIIAKLENIGPFQIFFTLTSGDRRWNANFTPLLEKIGCKLHYNVDPEGRENVTVEVKDGDNILEVPWQQYLKDHVDQSLHERITDDVLLATRNFQHRVEVFRREVIFGRNNPMRVRHISYRVEFQGRGAAHIHGVLWLDMKELKVEGVQNSVLQEAYIKLRHSKPLDEDELRALERFTDTFVTCTRCVSLAGEEAVRIAEETNWHGHSKSCKKGGARTCRWKFPRYPLARTIFVDANREEEEDRKLKASDRDDILDRVMRVLVEEREGKMVLSRWVKNTMLNYTNVVKISSEDDESSEENPEENVETPPLSPSTENPEIEQYSYPDDPPSEQDPDNELYDYPEEDPHDPHKEHSRAPIQKPDPPSPERQHSDPGPSSKKKAKATKPKRKPNAVTYVKRESPAEYKQNIRERIEKMLKKASVGMKRPISYWEYEKAVIEQPRKGSEVLLQRDIDEIFINNYNPEWMVAWNANIDISPVYDYFGTITYITDYFTKDSTGLTEVLKNAVKQLSNDTDMRQKCHELANTFLYHRQVGMSEAIYKLFANMHMVYSSIATQFVPTVPSGQRRNFLQRQDPEGDVGFKIADKNGLFLEKPDLISKYERRKLVMSEEDRELFGEGEDGETLEQMTFCQWVKMYQAKKWKKEANLDGEVEEHDDEDHPEEGELAEEDDFNFLTATHSGAGRRRLPQELTLSDLMTGEPKILNKRKFPRALRYYKRKLDHNPHYFYLQELLLYHPFRDENQLFPDDAEKCEELYLRNKDEIKYRKAQLMPFLESVEEAQLIYEDMKANEERNLEEEMGADLDPETEQDIADLDDLEEEHPDYYHIDPNHLDDNIREGEARPRGIFKPITLPNREAQIEEARMLDKMQKLVLAIGVNYAKRLVMFSRFSPCHKIPKPSPPLVMVHGGAGSGKSRVISSIYNMMTDIFQKQGDDPSCPYVVLTSFTGAASANINGQTLHSLFGFKFGTTFLSMPEKTRAEKQLLFRNLRCVIIDEISMVSADLLYNLDMRLREITGRLSTVFGGLSVFCFGDLFQLQPPKARYVFEKPTNEMHGLTFTARNLWRLFKVVNLVENHRQGDDKTYGDMLNRIRIGIHTEEDMALLETRVCSNDDPNLRDALHIYGTNAKVNARNNKKLEEIEGELFTIKAKNASKTIKKFKVNNAGCIKNTPFQAILKLKIGAEVTLVHNVDTLDGLTNGCRGVLVGVEKNGEAVKRLIVKFHNPNHGSLARQKNPCYKHPGATYIDPIFWQYFLGGATASVLQFPLKGAAGISSHKIQGQTVPEPNHLVIDITSSHQAGMVYVMLSRVCNINQLHIVDKVIAEKITVNEKVLREAKRMAKVSVNLNPCDWMNPKKVGLRVCSFNTSSLRKHVEDIRTDPVLMQSDILFVLETWLEADEGQDRAGQDRYQLEGYRVIFTSVGRGKGIATYVKDGVDFNSVTSLGLANIQTVKLEACKVTKKRLDIIAMYRSQEESVESATSRLKDLINPKRDTLIVGDFNFCATTNNVMSRYLEQENFQQLVTLPTHIMGNILDQAHHRGSVQKTKVKVSTLSHYFSDHNSINCIVTN